MNIYFFSILFTSTVIARYDASVHVYRRPGGGISQSSAVINAGYFSLLDCISVADDPAAIFDRSPSFIHCFLKLQYAGQYHRRDINIGGWMQIL